MQRKRLKKNVNDSEIINNPPPPNKEKCLIFKGLIVILKYQSKLHPEGRSMEILNIFPEPSLKMTFSFNPIREDAK